MELSTLKQLKELSKRLQGRGFSWHHDDYFCLREALPELIEHHLTSRQSRAADVCPKCGEPLIMGICETGCGHIQPPA